MKRGGNDSTCVGLMSLEKQRVLMVPDAKNAATTLATHPVLSRARSHVAAEWNLDISAVAKLLCDGAGPSGRRYGV